MTGQDLGKYIRSYINTPIDITRLSSVRRRLIDEGNINLNQRLLEREHLYKNLIEYLEKLLGWISCNPSRSAITELTEKLFIFNDACSTPNHLNCGINCGNKFLDLLREKADVVFIVGKKGAGKTYYQNYILNKESHFGMKELRYVWFRIDMTKIYRLNGKRIEENAEISITKYLYMQITYVFFRYSYSFEGRKIDPQFSKIDHNLLRNEVIRLIEKMPGKKFDKEEYRRIKNSCRENIDTSTIRKCQNEWMVEPIAMAITNLLRKDKRQILIIIDGIDNIDYSNDALFYNYYKEIISHHDNNDEVEKFKIGFNKVILVCRDETAHLILHKEGGESKGKKELRTKKSSYTVDPTSLNKVLDQNLKNFKKIKKLYDDFLESLNNKPTEVFINKTINIPIPDYILKDIYEYARHYTKYLSYHIEDYTGINIPAENILEEIYNNSLRDCIQDIISSYVYLLDFTRYEKIHSKHNSLSIYSFCGEDKRHLNNSLFKKNRAIIMEAISKNGYFYYNEHSEYEPPFNLMHSINIFEIYRPAVIEEDNIGVISAQERDTYVLLSLYCLHFLKYCQENKIIVAKNDIIDEMNRIGYSRELYINNHLRKLLEYGMIETHIEINDIQNKLTWNITKRGLFTLNYLFNSINVLHTCSYGIYFPNFRGRQESLRIYKENWSEYPSSSIINVCILLRWLNTIHSKVNPSGDAYKNIEFLSAQLLEDMFNFYETASIGKDNIHTLLNCNDDQVLTINVLSKMERLKIYQKYIDKKIKISIAASLLGIDIKEFEDKIKQYQEF